MEGITMDFMSRVKVVKSVTLPILKQADGVPYYVRVTGAIFLGKQLKGEGEEAKQEPAHLMNITNLETGEDMQMIANTVMKSSLEEEYPENGYVGKCFQIERKAAGAGKRYKAYSIQEIEITEDEVTERTGGDKKKK
jgi:hypothetical protein